MVHFFFWGGGRGGDRKKIHSNVSKHFPEGLLTRNQSGMMSSNNISKLQERKRLLTHNMPESPADPPDPLGNTEEVRVQAVARRDDHQSQRQRQIL